MTKWQDLATTSHYQTAVAVRDALRSGSVQEAAQGIEELIDALSRSERRALESHLVRLMQHIIKWQCQPTNRSRSWQHTIANAREAIAEIHADTPSLTDNVIRGLWDRALRKAHREAESDMDRAIPPLSLTWDDVFTTEYSIEP
jgi:prophage DNA circulation protein